MKGIDQNMTKRIVTNLLLVTLIVITLPITAMASEPTDIENHWAKDVILWAIKKNYMSGTGNNQFTPNGQVTRAQIVQVLYNINKRPYTPNADTFNDTKTHWANDAIQWAAYHDIVSGTGNNKFSPDSSVTKEQAATIFHKYAEKDLSNSHTVTTIDRQYLNAYTDKNSISPWALEHMAWAVQYGLLSGNSNKLNPKNILTRAELAQLLYNYENPRQTTNLPSNIQDQIQNTDLTKYKQYFDSCDSTQLEREVMLCLTNVKFSALSPNQTPPKYINQLWYDPRYVAKTTIKEIINERSQQTKRMRDNPNQKDYFSSIYKEKNLQSADYVDTFWYYVINIPQNKSAKNIASELLKNQDFRNKLQTSAFTFYGIYIDTTNNLCCIAHGNATAIK